MMNENLSLPSDKYKVATSLANKIRRYKYPRFGKYVLHKVQVHSSERHCLVCDLKESKCSEVFFHMAVSSISE